MDAELQFWLLNGLRMLTWIAVFAAFGMFVGRVCRPHSGVAFAATCIGTVVLYVALLALLDPRWPFHGLGTYGFVELTGGWALFAGPAIPISLFTSSRVPPSKKI